MEVSGRAHALHPLFPGEMLSLSTYLEVGWMPGVVWTLRKRERILPLGGIELRFLRLPTRSLTAIPITRFRLSYNSSIKAAASLNVGPAVWSVRGRPNKISVISDLVDCA
jgi:hypothetical protein